MRFGRKNALLLLNQIKSDVCIVNILVCFFNSRDILKENSAKPDDSVCNGNEFDVDLPRNLEPGNTNSYKDLCASGEQLQVSQETEEIPMMMSCEDEPNEAVKIQTGYKLPRWNVANETATVLLQQHRKPRPQNTKAKAETSKSRMTVRQSLEVLRNLNSTPKAVAPPIVLETSLAKFCRFKAIGFFNSEDARSS